MKRWVLMLLAVLVLVAVVGGIKALQIKKMIAGYEAMGEPRSTVSTIKVANSSWQPTLSAVGSLRAVRGVELAAETTGRVVKVAVQSGANVQQGEVLFEQDRSSDLPRLQALEAELTLSRSIANRAKQQLAIEGISKADAEAAIARADAAAAAVAEQRALIAKKQIRAPFSGVAGITSVNTGQYLNPGDRLITVQQLDPILVDFSLPQSALARVANGQQIELAVDAYPGKKFVGTVNAVNPVVHAQPRHIPVQARLHTPGRQLLPGMFGNLLLQSGTTEPLLTVPQSAISYNPYGETVFVVVPRGQETAADPNKPKSLQQAEALKAADAQERQKLADDKAAAEGKKSEPAAAKPASKETVLVARQVFVTVGATRGDQVAILKGLKEGDEVVTSGQLKLKNGSIVVINNTVQPGNDAAPSPVDQ